MRKVGQGSWKRIENDRRAVGGQKSVQQTKNAISSGIKRERPAEGETENIHLTEERGPKVKHQRVEYPKYSPLVEVASHEWPQVDK